MMKPIDVMATATQDAGPAVERIVRERGGVAQGRFLRGGPVDSGATALVWVPDSVLDPGCSVI